MSPLLSTVKAVYTKKKVDWSKWLQIKNDIITLLIKEYQRQGLATSKKLFPTRVHVSYKLENMHAIIVLNSIFVNFIGQSCQRDLG